LGCLLLWHLMMRSKGWPHTKAVFERAQARFNSGM